MSDVTVNVLKASPNLAVKADPAFNMYEVFTVKANVSVGITYVTLSAYSPSHTVDILMRRKSYDLHQVLQAIDTIL